MDKIDKEKEEPEEPKKVEEECPNCQIKDCQREVCKIIEQYFN